MFSVDLIDDLFSEGGLEKVLDSVIKEMIRGNLVDMFFAALPYLIGFFVVYSIFRNVVGGVFKNLARAGDSVVDSSPGLLRGFYNYIFSSGAPKEDATDKAQRLLGDGKHKEVAKFLRGHIKSHPNDSHAKALYEIALGHSSNNINGTYGNYDSPKTANVKTNNNANYDKYDNDDSYNTSTPIRSTRKIAELGSELVKAATGHKLTKEQMVHFAKTGKLPGQ